MATFLNNLQEKIKIQEGIEGHRSILREIYRAGHISLQDLSYKTTIPIPVLSKCVNFMIEKEMLSRIPEGILYTEQGMKFVENELNFYGYGLAECDECGGLPIYLSPRWDDLHEALEKILATRPTVDTTLDQAYADAETNIMRALFLYERGALEGKSICFLGDDDYTSVAVALLYLGFFPEVPHLLPNTIQVLDIDSRILEGIKRAVTIPENAIQCQQWDYRNAVPSNFLHKYDTLIVDPPYSKNGLKLVLSRCISLLRKNHGAEIYLSYAHRSAQELLQIQEIITSSGLAIKEMMPRFNIYEGASILGNTTQLYRLITTEKTKELIPNSEIYNEAIYTGEVSPNIRYYYCTNCDKMIAVGQKMEFLTIEELKQAKCPFCQSTGPFELDHKEDVDKETTSE